MNTDAHEWWIPCKHFRSCVPKVENLPLILLQHGEHPNMYEPAYAADRGSAFISSKDNDRIMIDRRVAGSPLSPSTFKVGFATTSFDAGAGDWMDVDDFFAEDSPLARADFPVMLRGRIVVVVAVVRGLLPSTQQAPYPCKGLTERSVANGPLVGQTW